MLYTVYHDKDPKNNLKFGIEWLGDVSKRPDYVDLDDFEKVAVVDVMALGECFRVTNHIDEEWQKNPEVVKSVSHARSTSVGDIVLDDTGNAYLCDWEGWHPLTYTTSV